MIAGFRADRRGQRSRHVGGCAVASRRRYVRPVWPAAVRPRSASRLVLRWAMRTVLARQAAAEWLQRLERERVAEELRAFAVEHAGSVLPLEDDVEDAAGDTLAEPGGLHHDSVAL